MGRLDHPDEVPDSREMLNIRTSGESQKGGQKMK
jgi:hypothetical protein